MADISFLRNEDMEDTDEPMGGADDDETGGDGPADGRGDEGGGESLPPMMKLQQHASCDMPYNRQLVGRILVEVFRGAVESGADLDVDEVMQPVLKLVTDSDAAVRLDLAEQLPHVAMICQEAPDRLGGVVPHYLIQIIVRFLRDVDQQVRQSTHAALLALIDRGLLDKNTAECAIAPTLISMSREIERLELFTLAIDGMSKVARIFDEATARRLFLHRYLQLCTDNNFFIRKLCAIRFGEFCAAMPKDVVLDRLLPIYVKLCRDPVWSVRKSCADVMVSFACCVPLHYRRVTLSEILARFLMDDSKWVKVSAFQILGPFISTFAKQFTGFSYNQYGELVLTDQHGTELRYNVLSFAGTTEPPPCKTAMTSGGQILQYYEEDGGVITKSNNVDNTPDTRIQWNSPGRSRRRSREDDWSENDATITQDHDEFNLFRFYYISPDLPLDSDLVEAALVGSDSSSSTVEASEETESDETRHRETNDTEDEESPLDDEPQVDQSTKEEISALDEMSKKKILKRSFASLLRSPEGDFPAEEAENSSTMNFVDDENRDDSNDSHGDTSSISLKNTSELLNDTVDIENISVDQSGSEQTASGKFVNQTIEGGQTIVPQILVNFFVSMADAGAVSIGIEIPRHCAFSFPAVALTLGRENWPLLKEAYAALADAREYRVRRTMASSIHELAMILGEELAARDLLPIYDGFIKDLDEVRIGALKHLTTFLKVLRPVDRRQFLPRLKAFLTLDNEWNWRFREEVASRLLEAIPLFTPADVSEHIAPLSFPLLIDKVAAVRYTALALVTQIICYLSNDEDLVTALITELQYMLASKTSKWTHRQSFALLCSSLISNEAISSERFGRDLLPSLLSLSSDVVPNVRLAVVTALSRHVVVIYDFLEVDQAEKVNQKLLQMRTDPDRDVRIEAGGFPGKYYPQGIEWKVPDLEGGW